MALPTVNLPIGKRVTLPCDFDESVILEEARFLGEGYEFRAGLSDGFSDKEAIRE